MSATVTATINPPATSSAIAPLPPTTMPQQFPADAAGTRASPRRGPCRCGHDGAVGSRDEGEAMDDDVHGRIERLVAEEHALWDREAAGEASSEDRARLQEVKVSLDQYWDLLRQRRALRNAG